MPAIPSSCQERAKEQETGDDLEGVKNLHPSKLKPGKLDSIFSEVLRKPRSDSAVGVRWIIGSLWKRNRTLYCYFFECYHWAHEINGSFKRSRSASAPPGNKGICDDYRRGAKRRQLYFILKALRHFQTDRGIKWLRVKTQEPARTGRTKMPWFKMTRRGSRLFSRKTRRRSTRLGGVKNQFRWGKQWSLVNSEVQLEKKKTRRYCRVQRVSGCTVAIYIFTSVHWEILGSNRNFCCINDNGQCSKICWWWWAA